MEIFGILDPNPDPHENLQYADPKYCFKLEPTVPT